MIEELRIDSLAFGGSGVGRQNGKVIFVPLTVPGDLVRCRIVREKKRHAEGEMAELLIPGPHRRHPDCPVFGLCGGCQWQHLDYGEQCRWKERIFADLLRRQTGDTKINPAPIRPSPDEWRYRSRVQFKCRQTDQGFVMGFYRRESHFVIDVPECPVAEPGVNEMLRLFRSWLPGCPCPERIPQVDVAVDDFGRGRAVVHLVGDDSEALKGYLSRRAAESGLALWLQAGRKTTLQYLSGEEPLYIRPEDDDRLTLGYGPGGFAQIHLQQNRSLVAEVLELADLKGDERVLDLFCGMGNFSLPLAGQAAEVVGVEDYAPSIASARENARGNGLVNAVFHARSAEGAAAELAGDRGFDLVLLDPPRTGAYQVARDLESSRPLRIIYISCDPATLARDLRPLLHCGYRVAHTRPFDLFSQTAHIESITLLERCG